MKKLRNVLAMHSISCFSSPKALAERKRLASLSKADDSEQSGGGLIHGNPKRFLSSATLTRAERRGHPAWSYPCAV